MVPMNGEQCEALLVMLIAEMQDKQMFDKLYESTVKEKDSICKVIEKRVEVFKLPKFEPSAVMFISMIVSGNPGKSVLAMIDTLDAWKSIEKKSDDDKIDAKFMSTYVYPFGFYDNDGFERNFNEKREKPKEGHNFLI